MFPFKVLEEKYRSIPDNVREAISSTEVNEKLQNIVNKYRLQFDEGEELTKEIGYVMLGLKSSDSFVKNIQRVTELDRETAEKIAEDVNNIILKDIKDSLRSATQKQEVSEEDDFDEIEQERLRDELLQEIEKPKESINIPPEINQEITTNLIEQPEHELQKITKPTENEKILNEIKKLEDKKVAQNEDNKESLNDSKEKIEQSPEKKYVMDPYREPFDL